MKLSIVIPVYFNRDSLQPLYDDLRQKAIEPLLQAGHEYELIFVDDGSEDESFERILELRAQDDNVVAVKLSRNYGSHSAILAGLSVATGDCAAMKSADLQEPSEIILQMIEKYEQGYSTVLAVRKEREEGAFQKLFSKMYYAIFRRLALSSMPKGGFDCFLIDRKVIDVLIAMDEKNTTLMGQILWCGFKTTKIYYTRLKRTIGKSRWTLAKKFKLVSDSIFGFSYFPIKFIGTLGVLFFIGAIIWSVVLVVLRLTGNIEVSGYTTLAIIMLFGFGILMLSMSILGAYIWRMFDATRNRPPYIIETIEKTEHLHDKKD